MAITFAHTGPDHGCCSVISKHSRVLYIPYKWNEYNKRIQKLTPRIGHP